MSEQNSIYDASGKMIARFRHGIAWLTPGMKRIGSYDSLSVYGNNGAVIASISGERVLSTQGILLGFLSDKDIYVNDALVGRFLGLQEAGAAAIALIFNPPDEPYK